MYDSYLFGIRLLYDSFKRQHTEDVGEAGLILDS